MSCLLVGDYSSGEVNALSSGLLTKGVSTVYRYMNSGSSITSSTMVQLQSSDELGKIAASLSLIIATSFDSAPPTFSCQEMALNELIRSKASDFMRGNIIILDNADLNQLMNVEQMKQVNVNIRRQLAAKAFLQLSDRDRGLHLHLMYNYDKRVVVIGGGGREHALAHSLSLSHKVSSVTVLAGNGGTIPNQIHPKVSCRSDINVEDYPQLIEYCKSKNISLVVIGPEQPLIEGIVNVLMEAGINCFGPSKEASILEASKAFSKDFFSRNGIPTASYETFSDYVKAVEYINTLEDKRVVVKASGIAAGKGVLLPESREETLASLKSIMLNKCFGDAGNQCVIEEFLDGEEVSVLAFCDGERSVCMPPAQDHKRALNNDQGLNTGGMGAYAPAPVATPRVYEECTTIIQNTIKAMRDEGMPYKGVLYGGFMVSDNGSVKVLEFNCRFGDPEAQVLLPLLSPQSDLYEIMLSCSRGSLNPKSVKFTDKAACTVVCAAPGYPNAYPKGLIINGLPEVYDKYDSNRIMVYHAGTKSDSGSVRTNGGRVLAVTGISNDLPSAIKNAYEGVSHISFDGMHYRTDIAAKSLETNRPLLIGVLGSTRGTALLGVLEAIANQTLRNVKVVCIVTNKKDAGIIDKAKQFGVDFHIIPAKRGMAREDYDMIVNDTLKGYGVQLVLMIGYMRIVSPYFTDIWKNRCMNVHPSLLPDFAGGMDLQVHEAVINAGRSKSGCTVHFVTEQVDGGPIVVQSECEVSKEDTPESLKAKVQLLEGQSFIRAIEMFRQGMVGPLNIQEVLTYRGAGVDIDAGEALVERIKPFCKATRRKGCDANLGGFGSLFNLADAGYDPKETILVSGTDGVGTKLKIAQSIGIHDTIGIDLVAMCVNDILVCGAEPLFFLDYYACGHLDINIASDVVKGIAQGCSQAGCALIGGETAEMAGMYSDGEYDLAGFSVGAVNKNKILPLSDIGVGDVLLALPSSGLHSNGFSLVRKIVEKSNLEWTSPCPFSSDGKMLGQALLCPTYIYVQSLLPLIRDELLKGMAHITGGGLLDNIPRVLPKDITAVIDFEQYPYTLPDVFRWLQQYANLPPEEFLRTFNAGIGMVLIVSANNVDQVIAVLASSDDPIGSRVFKLGHLKARDSPGCPQVVTNGSYSMV